MVLTIHGKHHYLWRAVDQEGYTLDILGRVCKPPPEMPENPLLAAQRGVMNLSDYEFGSFAYL